MKKLGSLLSIFVILLYAQSSCQQINSSGQVQPSVSPTDTLTLTVTPTSTATPTPTSTQTPVPTLTPTPAFITVYKGAINAPILLYHHISPNESSPRYNVDPETFDQQMKWLYNNGYQSITISNLAELIRNGGSAPRKPFILTIDDGNADIFNYAYPIMKKYGFVATFYVVRTYVNGKNMVTKDQLVEMAKNGWEIGSHSEHHVDLREESVDLEMEIRLSKLELGDLLGVPVNSFAYPFGYMNEKVLGKVWKYGYTSAVGLGSSTLHDMQSIYYLSRIEIKGTYPIEQFIAFFVQ